MLPQITSMDPLKWDSLGIRLLSSFVRCELDHFGKNSRKAPKYTDCADLTDKRLLKRRIEAEENRLPATDHRTHRVSPQKSFPVIPGDRGEIRWMTIIP